MCVWELRGEWLGRARVTGLEEGGPGLYKQKKVTERNSEVVSQRSTQFVILLKKLTVQGRIHQCRVAF